MIGTLAWTSIDRFGQQVVQLVIGIALARLLSPDDYSLIALVMIFITLANTLIDGGFGNALVRKQDANELDFNTVFYFNTIVSGILYLVLYFIAPHIASFYDEPKLTLVARVVFLAIIFNAFYLISNVKLAKALNFKTSAFVNISAVFLSGIVGITVALKGFGVWALVSQQLTFPFFRAVIAYCKIDWKPRLMFSFAVIKGFFSYSISLLGTSILNTIFLYIYVLIVGKFFPKQEVGFYYQANKLNESVNFSFQAILGNSYHVFVKIQDDTDRFRRVFRELVRNSSVLILPLLLVLIVIADPLIHTMLSAKWAPSIPYFQLLCLASLFNSMYTISISALNARGNSKFTFGIEIFKKVLTLVSIFAFLKYGISWLLVGFALANWMATLASIIVIKRELNHFWRHQLADFLPSLLIGILLVVSSYGWLHLGWYKHYILLAQLITGGVVYLVSVRIVYPTLFKNVVSGIWGKLQALKK